MLLAISVWYHLSFGLSFLTYLFLFIAYSLFLFYGSYFVSSNFFLKVTCSVKTTDKVIAISFDDGPALAYTPQILKLLNEQQVKAAFFCIGNRIADNEALLLQVYNEGHMIGNHSYSHHFWFDLFSSKKMSEDLKQMEIVMQKVTGLKPRLFRPPYGVTNPNLKKAIEENNYIPVGWNVRSMDTVITDETKLLNKVLNAIKPGAIVLFHDTSKTTLGILPAFIKHVNNKGYRIVRLDELLKINAYA
jgi:peptidoglycan/xylan/chitin deacetylase (PgdA/CDA1 family)